MNLRRDRMYTIFWNVLFIVSFLLLGINGQTYRDLLKTAIFTTAAYDSDTRPYCGNNEVINVTLDLALRQLIDLNEPTQILKLNVWVRLKWKDCRFVWNASDYGGIDHMTVPYKKVWIPDLTLYDGTTEEFYGKKEYTPTFWSDGTVYYNFPSVLESSCAVNVRLFPYDEQECKLVFGSWAYHGLEINFEAKNSAGDLSSSETNVEWQVSRFPAIRHVIYYGCCPEPYPDVTFYLQLKRKPLFYIVNLILPSFLITVMGVFGFFLPCESGEKVSLQITVLLALAVFQLIVAEALPPSAESIPLIAIYFDFSIFLVGFACVMSVVVLNVHYRGNRPIPMRVRKLFFGYLAKISFTPAPSVNRVGDKESKREDNNNANMKKQSKYPQIKTVMTLSDVSDDPMVDDEDVEQKTEKKQPNVIVSQSEEWKILAAIIDIISCYFYIIVGFIGVVVIFAQLSGS